MSEDKPAPLTAAPIASGALRGPDAAALAPSPPSAPPPTRRERRQGGTRRRGRRRLLTVVLVLVLLAAAAGIFAGVRLRAPDPTPVVRSTLQRTVDVAPQPEVLPWPQIGEAAVAIPSIGVDMPSASQKVVPVASLTKLMTAYVILHDHPLEAGQLGPSITVTQADVDDYDTDTMSDDSNAQVAVGEQIPEEQVLGGLLIHSADNYGDLLARWDAGTASAFVDKMNADAVKLGMTQSHFADASGVNPASESTPSDMLKVATLDMEDPVFSSLVRETSITLPVAGTISTYTPFLGIDGVIGVKSGFTSQAGGCDILAVVRMIDGVPTLLLAAVTGQQGPAVLAQAGLHALALVNALPRVVQRTPVVHQGQVVAHVTEAGRTVDALGGTPVSLLTWPGVKATMAFYPTAHLTDKARRGDLVGHAVISLGTQRFVVPVHLQQDMPRPDVLQRLF